jgi:hypothetical protein
MAATNYNSITISTISSITKKQPFHHPEETLSTTQKIDGAFTPNLGINFPTTSKFFFIIKQFGPP